jgi:hypothetical protein
MPTDKKSVISLEALVRTIGFVLLFLLIIFPAYNKISSYFSYEKYSKSFENFVNKINKMELPKETITLLLNEKSAIIGFSKNSEGYECVNCYELGTITSIAGAADKTTIIFNKPNNKACSENACICFCSSELKILRENFKSIKYGKCTTELICKKIENKDITNKVTIKTYLGGGSEYWKNGFLFANGVQANGLELHDKELIILVVEKKSNIIGICNNEMLEYNKNKLDFDGCLVIQDGNAKK